MEIDVHHHQPRADKLAAELQVENKRAGQQQQRILHDRTDGDNLSDEVRQNGNIVKDRYRQKENVDGLENVFVTVKHEENDTVESDPDRYENDLVDDGIRIPGVVVDRSTLLSGDR